MIRSLSRTVPLVAVLLCLTGAGHAAKNSALPTIAKKTAGMRTLKGLFRLHLDELSGKVWLELPPPRGERQVAAEFLYVEGLRTGLGSNPVGLDRGQLGSTRWIVLRRIGPRVLLEQLNPRYRAETDRPAERRAAAESFATSVLWGQEIAALDKDGRSLVDLTSFLVRDAHGVVGRLAAAEQGEFSLDRARSAVDLTQCLAFPDNLELEAVLTYAGNSPGGDVRQTAPSANSVTLVQHHSLVRLPDDDYQPRRFDPRAGSYAVEFLDYSVGLDQPTRRGWIVRHRLQKVDRSRERSRVLNPIVYYVDPGVPEPVRGALVDGASWWADAFDAAGFIEAFRVELLPEDAHPLDVRYNMIEWVHRSTRGWSYGGGVIDPRTGEMLKGHVLLGSLRVRQDRLLFEGLVGTASTGSGAADDPVELALARIRQLAAHEVGHALGLSHNFAASTYGDRASVMDYPAPLVQFDENGEFDLSRAYGVGVGAWDRHAVRYAYSATPPGADENAMLERIVRDGLDAGYVFLTDDAARPAGAADPRANLWDNGDDPVRALELTMRVRRHALDRFGERNVREGVPLAHLQEVLGPLYFHHRYQVDAAVKVVGGMEFNYAVRGDGQFATRRVSAERQRIALDTLLNLLMPDELTIPDAVLALLAPRPNDEKLNREMFGSATAPAFDAIGAAATAAALVIDGLLQPERLSRLSAFHDRDPEIPDVDEVVLRTIERVFDGDPEWAGRNEKIVRVVQSVLVQRLIELAQRPGLRTGLRASAESGLERIRDRIRDRIADRETNRDEHAGLLAREISRFLERPHAPAGVAWSPTDPIPGSPIGSGSSTIGGCNRN